MVTGRYKIGSIGSILTGMLFVFFWTQPIWPQPGRLFSSLSSSPARNVSSDSSVLSRFPGLGSRGHREEEGSRIRGDSWWARDKRLHLVASAASVAISYHLLHDRWRKERHSSTGVAISLTALAGMIKEVSDRRKVPPNFGSKDLIADGLGILAGISMFTR